MGSKGAGEWELEYPVIEGDSARGPLFKPVEKTEELHLRLFTVTGSAHYQPVWVELNGHALNVYNEQSDEFPAVRFDLKELACVPAAKGLPRKEIEPDCPTFAVVSRYHFLEAEGSDEVPPSNVFFFDTGSIGAREEWLHALHLNAEWALRFSGMFYPVGSARVLYSSGSWSLKMTTSHQNRYLRRTRLLATPRKEGHLYKKGSKFSSQWKSRFAAFKGTCSLEYMEEKGGEVKGSLNLSGGRYYAICNDQLSKDSAISSLMKRERSNTKRGTFISGLKSGSGGLTSANLYWYAVVSAERTYYFRSDSAEEMEQWMHPMRERCNDYVNRMKEVERAIKAAEKKRCRPRDIRYGNHSLPGDRYPLLERGSIAGRPSSGVYSDSKPVRKKTITTKPRDRPPRPSSDIDAEMDAINALDDELDEINNLGASFDDLSDEFDEVPARKPRERMRSRKESAAGSGPSQASFERLQRRMEQRDEENEELELMMEDMREEMLALKEELRDKKRIVLRQERRVQELEEGGGGAQEEIMELRIELEEQGEKYKKALEMWKEKYATAMHEQSAAGDYEEELERLQDELQVATDDFDDLQHDFKKSQRKLEAAEAKIASLQEELVRAQEEAENSAASSTSAASSKELERLNEENDRLLEELRAAEARGQENADVLQDVTAELQLLSDKLVDATLQLEQARKFESKLRKLKEVGDPKSLKKQLAEKERENAKLRKLIRKQKK